MLIKDRLVCSYKSKNPIPGTKGKGKYYSRRALEAVAPRIEGNNIYLNHQEGVPKGRRKFEDLIGRAVNVHIGEGGLRADFELSDYHPETKRIEDHFNKNLPLGGMSPDWDCRYSMVDGEQVIMEIKDINSLDIVAEPAGGRICESDDTPLTPEEEKFVEIKYVPADEYNKLLERVNILEGKNVQSMAPAYAPMPPAQPSFAQPIQNINVSDLIKSVRGL